MNKKHIITIAGSLGSGKSSTAKKIASMLNYTHYSTGDFMRAIASDRGLSLQELSAIAENDPSIDKELDDRNMALGKDENIVLDSRLGFYFIPESFKVFLDLDPSIASLRILKDKKDNPNRSNESNESFDTPESIALKIKERLISERKRYKELYGIEDHTAFSNFDLVINTKDNSLEEVASKIVESYNSWLTS
jgi:cytidylate kinase